MDLKITAKLVLDQLITVLDQMRADHYALSIPSLNASVSQHVRHILEFYICLFDGLQSGMINYDNRKRDPRIENDISFTLDLINEIKENISHQTLNSDLNMELKYGESESDDNIHLSTNYLENLLIISNIQSII